MSPKRQRSVSATEDGRILLQKAKGSFEGGPLTYVNIEERINISEKTIGRFFRGQSVDRAYAFAIIQFLGLSEKDVLSLEDSLTEASIEEIKNSDTGNSNSAQQLIAELETALDQLNQNQDIASQAMNWLKANRKSLAQEAAEAILRKNAERTATDAITDELDFEQFCQEIRKYLQALYYCLEVGSWELIDRAIQDESIPVNREIESYTEALTFIKNEKVMQELSSEVAQTITLLLDYLIQTLPFKC